MFRKINRVALFFSTLLLVLTTLACQLETTGNPVPTGASSSDIRFTVLGSATDTWGWGQGSYTCDTQDEMKLTVNYANGAVLTLRGVCFWSNTAYDSCTEQQDGGCSLVVYGTYSDVTGQVTFTACNAPDAANGSGTVLITGGDKSPSIVSGDVYCSFSNTPEQHHIAFTTP